MHSSSLKKFGAHSFKLISHQVGIWAMTYSSDVQPAVGGLSKVLCSHVRFPFCVCKVQWQPAFILIFLKLTFSMQWHLVPVLHALRTGRFPGIHWHLGAKLISSLMMTSTLVFLCGRLVCYDVCCSISTKLSHGITLLEWLEVPYSRYHFRYCLNVLRAINETLVCENGNKSFNAQPS